MSFRNLDGNHDWTFGVGRNNYVTQNQEIALNIKTRVLSFLGDCFFATDEGIDYWNLLEYNKQAQLENAIMSTIAETDGVQKVNNIDVIIGANRKIMLEYSVYTIYSTTLDAQIPLNEG